MKKSIGKMRFIDRNDPDFQSDYDYCDFEVLTISANADSYEGCKLDMEGFHCFKQYWKYEPYPEPKEVIIAGQSYLLNFYDRSGDNWEPVKILFVGESLFVYEHDGVECSAYLDSNEFRDLESN